MIEFRELTRKTTGPRMLFLQKCFSLEVGYDKGETFYLTVV